MDIGTAKVSAADRARVPHHGLDLVDPDEPFTAADYRRAARSALEGIAARGGMAIMVGGTGLYLRAVARGFPLDETGHDPQVRADIEARLVGEGGLHQLVAELRSVAPGVAARTDLANPRRVVRALERVTVHGDTPPPPPQGYPAPSVWIGLQVEPAIHRDWIADRARAQFANGLLEEAAGLTGALRPEPACVLGVWLPRGFCRERRQPDSRSGNRARHHADQPVRAPSAHVVSCGAGYQLARRDQSVTRGSGPTDHRSDAWRPQPPSVSETTTSSFWPARSGR